MRLFFGLLTTLAALGSSSAMAACEPAFASSVLRVNLAPISLDDGTIIDRFDVRLRNDGDTICTVRLAVGRDAAASDISFPSYTLSGPEGNIFLMPFESASNDPSGAVDVTIPAGGETTVSYEVRADVGWDSRAGNSVEELVYLLLPEIGELEIASARTTLALFVPSSVRVRFAGALGEMGPAIVDMGELSPTAITQSPPFAIRVLSTSGYRMELASLHGGSLLRSGGDERIVYQVSVGQRPVDLRGAGAGMDVPSKPGLAGDIHPISISIAPNSQWHAGNYSDRITVIVTAF